MAAAITNDQILQWIGINNQNDRNQIGDDMFPQPEGLRLLNDETEDGISEACAAYGQRTGNGRIYLGRAVVK